MRDRVGRLLCVVSIAAWLLPAVATAQSDPSRIARRVGDWRDAWRSGRIALTGPDQNESIARRIYGNDLITRAPQVLASHLYGLRALLEDAAEGGGPESAAAVLTLAAEGLGESPLPADRQVEMVRAEATHALARMQGSAALDLLLRAARGDKAEVDELKPWRNEYRIAALRALGGARSAVVRFELERQLGDRDREVRIAAAESLAERGSARSLDALGDAIVAEKDPLAALVILDAMHGSIARDGEHMSTETARRALSIALDQLGRFDWRCDTAIVEIAGRIRSPMSIEPLIGVLERCLPRRGGNEALRAGTLRERAQTVLRDLTGTLCQADRPDQWRAFWSRVRDDFRLPPPRDQGGDEARTTSGFFGIPVSGLRVLFVIDTSGSMNTPITGVGDGGTSSGGDHDTTSRLERAKQELLRAVASLPPDARFGVIAFSGEATRLDHSLWPANDSGRAALRHALAGLSAGGATNLYGALADALDLGDPDAARKDLAGIDELFVLSDGQPSAGACTDTEAILAAVHDANRYRHVRIHTVMLGGAMEFVRRLAEENGGRCVEG
ncbi:MAG: VWA domain-containing protein [Planctomycetota bacterium]